MNTQRRLFPANRAETWTGCGKYRTDLLFPVQSYPSEMALVDFDIPMTGITEFLIEATR